MRADIRLALGSYFEKKPEALSQARNFRTVKGTVDLQVGSLEETDNWATCPAGETTEALPRD
jgi:hypothetical protein